MNNKPATSKIEAFQKILNLEAETGFQDKVVSGGLDRFLERFASDPHPDVKKLSVNRIFNITYRQLSHTRRKSWVNEITRLMGNTSGKPERPPSIITPDSPITELRSVSRGTAAKFSRLSVSNLRDLIYLFPRRHLDYSLRRTVSQLVPGKEQTIVVSLWEVKEISLGKGGRLRSTEAVVGDETGNIYVIWFGQRYLARTMQRALLIAQEGTSKDVKLVLSGKVTIFNGRRQIESPEWEILQKEEMASLVHTGRIVPIYPTTEGFQSQRTLRKIIREALDLIVNPVSGSDSAQIEDPLPGAIRKNHGLLPLNEALTQFHYPDTLEARELARRSLAFDELLVLQLAMARKRLESSPVEGALPLYPKPQILNAFLKILPFSLTMGQNDAIRDALNDMLNTETPMGRLLQGDVGSGKTVVALALLLVTVANGFQGAFMAPTEILAEQHFLNIAGLFREFGHFKENEHTFSFSLDGHPKLINVGLLIGSTPAKIKRDLQQQAGAGILDVVVGTQTLIQQSLELPNLALGIVDEQHRFGVLQRVALRSKGQQPHLLAMTATPIPRSLAETLYGDLDVSIIPKPPTGRPPITTRTGIEQNRAEALVVSQTREGRQAFVVCPLIEESEALQTSAATKEFTRLQATSMADLRLGLLHGRLPLKEKQLVMDAFRKGELDVLVCTPVIEVGIDIPNATVMLIQGADRFGLAQLHQLRGRVGRGPHPSFCILLAETPSEEANRRFETLVESTDGFHIAEMDLRLRGQGDFFGTRQSGLPNLRIAQMSEDFDLISKTRIEAQRILKSTPKLLHQKPLGKSVERYMLQVIGETA